MQTVNNPSELPERAYSDPAERRVKLDLNLLRTAGILGYEMMLEMYERPYEPFLPKFVPTMYLNRQPFQPYTRWDVEQLAQCIGKGLVGMDASGNGFQLTAEGRLYMAEDLARKPSQRPVKGFDERDLGLLDGPTPELEEYNHRLDETY